MLAAIITIWIVALVFTLALCRAAGQADEKERQWIEQRKREDQEEFDGYKYCDDDWYMCDDLERCKKAVKGE